MTGAKETLLRCHTDCFCHEQCICQNTRNFIDVQNVAVLLRRCYLKRKWKHLESKVVLPLSWQYRNRQGLITNDQLFLLRYLCLGNMCCYKDHLTRRKKEAMFVASKHKVVAVKIKLKSTGRMVFVWRKWDTVFTHSDTSKCRVTNYIDKSPFQMLSNQVVSAGINTCQAKSFSVDI